MPASKDRRWRTFQITELLSNGTSVVHNDIKGRTVGEAKRYIMRRRATLVKEIGRPSCIEMMVREP